MKQDSHNVNAFHNSQATTKTDTRKWNNLTPHFSNKIALLKIAPGMPATMLRSLIKKGIQGIVIEGYGTGNLPFIDENFPYEIREAVNVGAIVAIATQCRDGGTDIGLYETGRKLFEAGAIECKNMTSGTAYAKMSWIMGQKLTRESKVKLFTDNLVGEYN